MAEVIEPERGQLRVLERAREGFAYARLVHRRGVLVRLVLSLEERMPPPRIVAVVDLPETAVRAETDLQLGSRHRFSRIRGSWVCEGFTSS